MPYVGGRGEQLFRSFKRKLRRCLQDPSTKILARIETTRINTFANVNDATPKPNRFNMLFTRLPVPGRKLTI